MRNGTTKVVRHARSTALRSRIHVTSCQLVVSLCSNIARVHGATQLRRGNAQARLPNAIVWQQPQRLTSLTEFFVGIPESRAPKTLLPPS